MPHRKGHSEMFPDETVGQIALHFASRDEMIRCLDMISTLGGLACQAVPWTTVIGPKLLVTLCAKNGIPAKPAKVVPPGAPLSEEDSRQLSEQMVRISHNLDAALHGR